MKKILFLFVIVMIFIICNIQSAYCKVSIVYEEDLSYKYSDTAQYHRIITLIKSDSINWVNQNLELTAFDNQNRIVEEIYKSWYNETWLETYRIVYKYDTIAQINIKEYYGWKNNDWILNNIDSIYYLNNGLIDYISHFYLYNNQSVKEQYSYKILNNNYIEGQKGLTDELYIYYKYKLFKTLSLERDSINYGFNNKNQLSGISFWDIYDPKIPDSWFPFSSITIDYNNFDSIIYEHYKCEILSRENYTQYGYDSKHRKVYEKGAVIYYFGGPYEDSTVTDYSYDDSDRIILQSTKQYHDSANDWLSISDIKLNNIISCFPNPFSFTTNIKYTLEKADNVSLVVYSVSGSEMSRINLGFEDSGEHTYNYNAAGLQSGFYYYVLRIGSKSYVNKMEIIR